MLSIDGSGYSDDVDRENLLKRCVQDRPIVQYDQWTKFDTVEIRHGRERVKQRERMQ